MNKFDELLYEGTGLPCPCGKFLYNFQIRDFDNKFDQYKIGKKDRKLYKKTNADNPSSRNSWGFPVFDKDGWKHLKITKTIKGYTVCTHCKKTWFDLTMYIECGILVETILVVTRD